MATAFDGLGMGMLGSEKKYMSQDNPLSTAFKGLKDFGIMYGMEKAGVFDYLNKVGEQKQAMMDKYPGLSAKKPDGSAAPPAASAPVPAVTNAAVPAADNSATVDNNQNPLISDDAADNLFKNTSGAQPGAVINQVLPPAKIQPGVAAPPPVVGGAQISGVSPDVIQPRNMGQDQLAMDVAVAQPPPLNLSQYGKQGGGGGGSALSALSSLFTLFA